MYAGRQRAAWERTAALLAQLWNTHATSGRPKSPDDYNPWSDPRPLADLRQGIGSAEKQLEQIYDQA